MSKAEWGIKRLCAGCGAKYYDLSRTPILCPKCGVEFDPDAVLRSRRTKPAAKEEPKPKPAAVAEPDEAGDDQDAEPADDALEVADPPGDDDADDDALIEDVSELGEDEDDMGEVVVKDEDDSREG